MKTLKFTLLLVAIVISNLVFAQKTLFQALEANGEDAVYTVYTNVSPNKTKGDGYYNVEGKRKEKVHLKIFRSPNGIPMGVHIRKVSDGERIGHATTEYSNTKMDHYPLVIAMQKPSEAFIVIDDLAFFVRHYDYHTGKFESINEIFVLDKPGKETNKKKKKGGFLNKLKDRAIKNYTKGSLDANQKRLKEINLKDKIAQYWKAMHSKQTNYQVSAKDKKELQEINDYRTNKHKKIRAKNAAYEKMAAEYRAKNGSSDDSKDMVTIKNETGKDIYIYVGGSKNADKIYHLSSTEVNCKEDVTFKFDPNTSGNGRSIYSSGSKCGGSVTVK